MREGHLLILDFLSKLKLSLNITVETSGVGVGVEILWLWRDSLHEFPDILLHFHPFSIKLIDYIRCAIGWVRLHKAWLLRAWHIMGRWPLFIYTV